MSADVTKTGHKILPHGKLEQLAPNVWQLRGSLPFPLPRNMTVYRMADGNLLLHSVVAMDEEGMRALEALGAPTIMVMPHGYHRMDAAFYKKRYPGIKVVCPTVGKPRVEEMGCKVDATPEEVLVPLGMKLHPVAGVKHGEYAIEVDVPGGKALLMSDVIGGPYPDFKSPLMMRIVGVPGGHAYGVARIYRWRMTADKAAVRGWIQKTAELPNIKLVTIAHGPPITADIATKLRDAATTI